ncbi:hypothetical protein [Sphingomonas sp.]|uniref:hypothetical protein n=1 Tax=Sphingomonas sp. TaxID=28214 RepID=UPI00286E9794|nr:hypothetical protein [Sphingomonas sp.]
MAASRLAQRRYVLRVAVATAFYLVTLALALRVVGGGLVEGPAAYVLAILPGLSIVGIFWAFARLLIEETDEYRRLLLVGQSLIATAFTLSVATVWGFLENFGLVAHVDGFYIAVLWFVGLGVGSLYNRLTLGDDAGGCGTDA